MLRPRALEPASDAPAFVRGTTLIRGRVTPVLDLASLLGMARSHDASRLVVLRAGDRAVAMEVDAVRGVETLSSAVEHPPLLKGADAGLLAGLAERDGDLLAVLHAGRALELGGE